MASTSGSTKTIALIHNTNFERPLNVLSTAIAEYAKRTYFTPNVSSNYQIVIVDIADYSLPPASTDTNSTPKEPTATPARKTLTEWQAEISNHSGLILLFPYHTWSHCNPLKDALSILPPHIIHKPALMLGFGKEENYHYNGYKRTLQKKSFGMMKEFLHEKGVRLLDMEKQIPGGWPAAGWPEFMVYEDYWEHWITGGSNAFIGGQQSEAWESSAWNRCQWGVKMMVEKIEKNRR